MQDLVTTMKSAFSEVLAKYSDSRPLVKRILADYPVGFFLRPIFGSKLEREIRLSEAKRSESKHFAARVLSNFSIDQYNELDTIREVDASQYSDLTEESGTDAKKADLFKNPKPKYFSTYISKKHRLDELSRGIKDEIEKVKQMREGHDEGHLDGLLAAMNSTINFLVVFYNRRGRYLEDLINIDDISESCDAAAQWFKCIAHYLAVAAYDNNLAQYYEQHLGLRWDAQYFLNSGFNKLTKEERNNAFMTMYIYLGELAVRYRAWLLYSLKLNELPHDVPLEINMIIDLVKAQFAQNTSLGSEFLQEVERLSSLPLWGTLYTDAVDKQQAMDKITRDVAAARIRDDAILQEMQNLETSSYPASDEEIERLVRPVAHMLSGELHSVRRINSSDTEATLAGPDSGRSSAQQNDVRCESSAAVAMDAEELARAFDQTPGLVTKNMLFSVDSTLHEAEDEFCEQGGPNIASSIEVMAQKVNELEPKNEEPAQPIEAAVPDLIDEVPLDEVQRGRSPARAQYA